LIFNVFIFAKKCRYTCKKAVIFVRYLKNITVFSVFLQISTRKQGRFTQKITGFLVFLQKHRVFLARDEYQTVNYFFHGFRWMPIEIRGRVFFASEIYSALERG
jgi:hypothetical protein